MLNVLFDTFSDGKLACTLADFRQIGTGETLRDTGQVLDVDLGINGRFSQICLFHRFLNFFLSFFEILKLS